MTEKQEKTFTFDTENCRNLVNAVIKNNWKLKIDESYHEFLAGLEWTKEKIEDLYGFQPYDDATSTMFFLNMMDSAIGHEPKEHYASMTIYT